MTDNTPALTGDIVTDLDLPSGGRVILRDPRELRAKDKQRVIRNIRDEGGRFSRNLDVTEGALCMLIARWEVPYLAGPEGEAAALPRDQPTILGELTIADYDSLIAAVGPAIEMLFPTPPAPEQACTPGSPTGPASG
jgi:hypothetical protein